MTPDDSLTMTPRGDGSEESRVTPSEGGTGAHWTPRLPSRHPRLAITALAGGSLAIGITESGTMGILPLIADGVGASIPQAGTLISAYALGAMVGAPLLAVLGARLPRRAMLLAFLAAYAALHGATGLVQDFPSTWVVRFLSGFPHGAYLGVASLVAADLVPLPRRAGAVAAVMLGFPVANLLGAPLGILLAQTYGWQTLYLLVAGVAVACAAGIVLTVPPTPRPPVTDDSPARGPLAEIGVLRRPGVWLVLATAGLGFGGAFATMSYVTPMLTSITGLPEASVSLYIALYGVGAALGAVLADRTATLGVARALVVVFTLELVVLGLLGWAAAWPVTAGLAILVLGAASAAIVALLQTRIMEVAAEGQTLAATLVQGALNMGNALGAWVGGMTIAAGLSYAWPSRAGAALALIGLLGALASLAYGRRHPGEDLGAAPELVRPAGP